MNLHSLVAGPIGIVNPHVKVTITPSKGYVTNADGSRTPAYGSPYTAWAQQQPMQYNDIQQIAGLNIQGVRTKFYIRGDWDGIVRVDQKGGDLITTPDGKIWLIAVQVENWGDGTGWTAVIASLQDGA